MRNTVIKRMYTHINGGNSIMNNEQLAKLFIESIQNLANNPQNLRNLETYLSYHFDAWMQKFANTPEKITHEIKEFANMEVTA